MLTFRQLECCTSMYDFKTRGKVFELTWRECYIQFDTFQRSRVSLLEPRQSNLSNPAEYSEPWQKLR